LNKKEVFLTELIKKKGVANATPKILYIYLLTLMSWFI